MKVKGNLTRCYSSRVFNTGFSTALKVKSNKHCKINNLDHYGTCFCVKNEGHLILCPRSNTDTPDPLKSAPKVEREEEGLYVSDEEKRLEESNCYLLWGKEKEKHSVKVNGIKQRSHNVRSPKNPKDDILF